MHPSQQQLSETTRLFGKRFTQASLYLNLQGALLGRSQISIVLGFLLMVGLAMSSGILAGAFVGWSDRIAFFPLERDAGLALIFCILLTVNVWLIETTRHGFGSGLWKTVLAVLLPPIIGAIYLRNSDLIFVTFFFNLLSLGAIFFALLANSLSWALIHVSVKSRNFIEVLHWLLLVLVAIATTILVGGTAPDRIGVISPEYFPVAKLISGLFAGFCLEKVSIQVTNFESKAARNFTFLQDWAIAISSWGGTSFYGLDLSNVNFRAARLANTDLRAKSLYRTCFQEVIGLDRARVDHQYLDLDKPQVQILLTTPPTQTPNFQTFIDPNFQRINLRGAFLHQVRMQRFDLTDANLTDADLYQTNLRDSLLIRTQLATANLQETDLRDCTFTDANLTGADCRGADLRDAILVRTQAARVDFSEANLTGICIEDWSISSQTHFTDVRCDYIFRAYENGKPSRRYPVDRNFEPDEFAALFRKPENEVELVFKGELDYTALSLAFYKLQTDEPELALGLKGIEQRGNLWVVKVTSSNPAIEKQLGQWFNASHAVIPKSVETIKNLGSTYQEAADRKAENETPLKQIVNFYISGGTITNIAGLGTIDYTEAPNQTRYSGTDQ